MEKGDCCRESKNEVSRQWSPVGWKPNPKTKRDQKKLLDDAFAGLGNAFTGSTDTANTSLRPPLTEQRVEKTQIEVEIRIRLGLEGKVTVGFYLDWRGNWRDKKNKKHRRDTENREKNVGIREVRCTGCLHSKRREQQKWERQRDMVVARQKRVVHPIWPTRSIFNKYNLLNVWG